MAILLQNWQKSIIAVNDLFTNLGMEIEIDWHCEQNAFVQLSAYPMPEQMVYWITNHQTRVLLKQLHFAKIRYDVQLKDSVGLLTDLNRWVIRDKTTLMIIENPQNIIFTHNRLASYEQNISGLLC